MRIAHKVAPRPEIGEERAEHLGMADGGLEHHCRWGVQPGVTRAIAWSTDSGEGNRSTFVESRRKARSAIQANPTVASPDSAPSAQAHASRWWSADSLTA